jgi:hypothetical protein
MLQASTPWQAATYTYRSLSQVPHPTVQKGRSSQLRGHICYQIVIEHGIVGATSPPFPVVHWTGIFRSRIQFRAVFSHFMWIWKEWKAQSLRSFCITFQSLRYRITLMLWHFMCPVHYMHSTRNCSVVLNHSSFCVTAWFFFQNTWRILMKIGNERQTCPENN